MSEEPHVLIRAEEVKRIQDTISARQTFVDFVGRILMNCILERRELTVEEYNSVKEKWEGIDVMFHDLYGEK